MKFRQNKLPEVSLQKLDNQLLISGISSPVPNTEDAFAGAPHLTSAGKVGLHPEDHREQQPCILKVEAGAKCSVGDTFSLEDGFWFASNESMVVLMALRCWCMDFYLGE